MGTEYFNSSNSVCSNSFGSFKRQRILSGDLKSSECDNESLMDYTAETSTKASSSSIQESIANMSNSHSTPEDNYSENTLLSPLNKQTKLDCEKDFDSSLIQYSKSDRGIFKSMLVSSNNHSSIDDTIEYVLSKIRDENDDRSSKSSFLIMSSSDTPTNSSSKYDINKFSNLNSISNRHKDLDNIERCYSTPYPNSNTQPMQYDSGVYNPNFLTSNCNKNEAYNYGNYYNIPSNLKNQMSLTNYNRPQFGKDSDKANLVNHQYQFQSMPYRPYMSNSYGNQPYYCQDSQIVPNQTFSKAIKRDTSFNHISHENDINQLKAHMTHFKAPAMNSCGIIEQNIRKRRPIVDPNKLTPTKKRKLIDQININNKYDDLVNKLKSTNNCSLLMNPPLTARPSLLPPLEFNESAMTHTLVRNLIQYHKYKSSPYFLFRPKHFKDDHQSDKFISDYVSETIPEKNLLSDKYSGGGNDNLSDIVCVSPECNDQQSVCMLPQLQPPECSISPVSPLLSTSRTSAPSVDDHHSHERSYTAKESETQLYTQLTGSFLKRTKINGKSFSNVHIEETFSVALLAASRSQNSCQNCSMFLTGISCTKIRREHSKSEQCRVCNTCYDKDIETTKVLIKTSVYKPSKNYKRVADFDHNVQRRIPIEIERKPQLPGIHYGRYKESGKLEPIDKKIDVKNDSKILLERYESVYRSNSLFDSRECVLCHKRGDDCDDLCGRLMNIDSDTWIHLNCGLWCFDVFETVSGSLVGVQSAVTKAVKTMCSLCQGHGAGIQCYWTKCNAVYHVPCAHRAGCVFYTDRGMYCPAHAVLNHPMQLISLRADRRVNVGRDECSLVANVILEDLNDVPSRIRLGSLTVTSVGQLLPGQLSSGHYNTSSVIYPVGFHSTRIYWSASVVNRRCQYECYIDDSDSGPIFRVEYCDSDNGEDREHLTVVTDRSCDNLWRTILVRIAKLRNDNGLTRLFPDYLSGEQLYGLTEPPIVRVIESLPGVDSICNYAFKFGRMELITAMPLTINPSGSARTEPKLRMSVRSITSAEAANKQSSCSVLKAKCSQQHWFGFDAPSLATILSAKACNSRIQQYKRLRFDWFNNVVLSRSGIQGLGLFAAKDLDKSTMIIEYIGETIRNEVGNRREQLYQSRNNSIYMFRLSDDLIIDATVRGGLARYINHSCDPNCQAEFLSLDSLGGRIVITTKQRIERGEELTYDYKFDFEDNNSDKIPCLCGAVSCRGWMN